MAAPSDDPATTIRTVRRSATRTLAPPPRKPHPRRVAVDDATGAVLCMAALPFSLRPSRQVGIARDIEGDQERPGLRVWVLSVREEEHALTDAELAEVIASIPEP